MSVANRQKRAFKAQALNMDRAMRQKPGPFQSPGSEPTILAQSDQDIFDRNGACSFIREFYEIEAKELQGQMPDSVIEKLEFTLVIQYGTQKYIQHHIKHLTGQAMPMQIKSPRDEPNNPAHVCVYLTKKQFMTLQKHWEQGKECLGLL